MTARLFCKHCNKFYEVDVEHIRLVQKAEEEQINFAHNTYFYEDGCFFTRLKQIRSEQEKL